MKNYKLIIILTLGLIITVVTTWKWQQITKAKNEIRSEIQKSTLKAQESLVYLKELSKEKTCTRM